MILIQADLVDFWRLCLEAGWRLQRHYVLYPNPWPKAKHLQRRWHGSPVWPTMLKLGGCLEVRSNWAIYIEEFAQALTLAGYQPQIEAVAPSLQPLTPFEGKYQASGHTCWRCIVGLD